MKPLKLSAHTPTLADQEIAIGMADPSCLDSMEDFADENACEARAAYQDGIDEYYEAAEEEHNRNQAIAKAEGAL